MKKLMRSAFIGLFVLIVLVTSGCGGMSQGGFDARKAEQALNAALQRSVTDENGQIDRNAVVYVEVPQENFTYTNAAGIGRADTGEAMTVDHQFFIASVGKPMTATVILQLWEEGAFGKHGLDATLDELHIFPPEVLDQLHMIDGVSYGRQITIRQLLNQTSGLKDVLNDSRDAKGEDHPETMGFAPGSLNYLVAFDQEKGMAALVKCLQENVPAGCSPDDYYLSRTWAHWDYAAWQKDPHDRMAGLINFYLNGPNQTALWVPGQDFYYSDTNYVILGLVIEKLTGNSLHHELRTRIFDPLGMDHTYLGYATEPPTTAWEGHLSDHWGGGYPLVSSGVNFSTDWGGGGEFSTVSDLNKFVRALGQGKLFRDKATLEVMTAIPDSHQEPYAAGLVVWPADSGLVLHHNGTSGSWVEYYTATGVSISGTVNDIDHPDRMMTLRADIYKALTDAGLKSASLRTGAVSVRLEAMLLGGQVPVLNLVLLMLSLWVFLAMTIIWGITIVRKRYQDEGLVERARRMGLLVTGWNLIFWIIFLIGFLSAPYQILFSFTSLVRLTLWMLPLSILLTLGQFIYAIQLWRMRAGKAGFRWVYTLVFLVEVGFLGALWQLGLLGLLT
jgi:D-alanyl-D-alanine carboxypeptidase